MIILINDKRIRLQETHTNLEAVLQEVATRHLNNNEIVWSVNVNETFYSESRPNEARMIPIDQVQSLEIGTKTKEELVNSFLESADDIIDLLKEGVRQVSADMRAGNITKGNQRFVDFLDTCRNFAGMVSMSRDLLPGMAENDAAQATRMQAFSNKLDEVVTAQQDYAWDRLAEGLDTGILPMLEDWRTMLVAHA